MNFLTKDSIIKWLSIQNLLNEKKVIDLSLFPFGSEILISDDSGKKTALSSFLASMFEDRKEFLIWINEFGIWPSSENWHLIEILRNSVGETRPLSETPGIICSGVDEIFLSSLLCLILYFNWGAIIIDTNKTILTKISHDGLVTLCSSDPQIINGYQNLFVKFKKNI
jgi:hypothetical protein